MRLNYKNILQKIKSLPQDWPQYQAWLLGRTRQLWENRLSWPQLLRMAVLASLSLFSLLLLLFFSIYFGAFGKLPSKADLSDIRNANASEIYAANRVLLGKYYAQNRTNASLDEIPYFLINGLVATEDARFYRHRGIDIRALLRVAVRTVLLGDLDSGGGSTISQQLIKNIYSRQNHGLLTIPVNKIREMILAIRIEKVYSKAEIMELYLNTVPYGEKDVYGVKVAAKRFFNKPLDQLSIQEAAVLVGMLKGNTLYNPISRPERSKERRNTVLNRMVKYNFLTSEIRDSLSQLPLETTYVKEGRNQGLATYFRAHIKSEVETVLAQIRKPDGSAYNLETDGLKIYTSIDASLQKYAEEAVAEVMPLIQANFKKDWKEGEKWLKSETLQYALQNAPRYQNLKAAGYSEEEILAEFDKAIPMDLFTWDTTQTRQWSPMDSIKHYLSLLQTGMIAIEPQTGAIKAWIGGINHGYFQYDHVKARRQVGSTFKPIVYASALEDAQYPCDFFENKRETYPEYENWSPRNSDGKYGGYYTMPGALSKSVNTVSVQLILDTGVDKVRTLANDLGISGELPEGPAISLGTMDASLLEMVQVYGTFANEGKRPVLHFLDRIEDSRGQLIYEYPKPEPSTFAQVISPETNALMVNMLQTVVDSGTARKLRYRYGINGKIAGKTGTTQDQSDGWFLGFTPNLVVGVWVGAELPSVHFRTLYRGQGGNTALPIAGTFLRKAYQDREYRKWRSATFSPMVDSLAFMLDCPHYLEEIPLRDELLEDYLDNPGFFDRLYRDLNQGDNQIPLQLKRRRNNETQEEYIERMRRYNERLYRKDEKREDLKKFWSDKLFGKKRKEEGGEQRND